MKTHPYFKKHNIDWSRIRQLPAPWKPKVRTRFFANFSRANLRVCAAQLSGETDTHYFDRFESQIELADQVGRQASFKPKAKDKGQGAFFGFTYRAPKAADDVDLPSQSQH